MELVVQVLKEFGLTFVPLFVAMDAIGVLPIMLPMTADMAPKDSRKVIRYATFTALGLGLGFVIIGKGIFLFMGIDLADFLVGGGLILFVLSAKELITGKMIDDKDIGSEMIGVVPLGTPLIVGPAVLTTLLILIDQYSVIIVLVSFIINIAIAWILLVQAQRIVGFLGKSGIKAISKIVGLLLAAIAIKMIRQGIVTILGLSG
jgi:multiple antibiotic resistance protein